MYNSCNLNDLVAYYYYTVGYNQENDAELHNVTNVLQYLIDCQIDKDSIIKTIEQCADNLSFDNLPDFLWGNSILRKNVFYLHNFLRISVNSSVVDIFSNNIVASNPAIEMKIRFSYDDLLDYYVEVFDIDKEMLTYKKEIGSLQYLIELCEKQFSKLNAIDIVLSCIDSAANNSSSKIYNILDIQSYLYETVNYLNSINNELIYNQNNKIVWRK